jgi:phosphoenolpyruvate carboxykinase (GTP)
VWWEGSGQPPTHLTDWHGNDWTPGSDHPAAHPNSRFCTPIRQCPILAPEYDDPRGVPISAILFGGRRKTTVPLVTQSLDWNHGVFMGATLSSETTAAAVGEVGVVRRDPMAMLPFIGYHAGDYLAHWLAIGKQADSPAVLPTIFQVNWFRRSGDGRFLWPGYGENSRILKWIIERLEGTADAVMTPIGLVPYPAALDTEGVDISDDDLVAALTVDVDEWTAELPGITDWFTRFGDRLPATLWTELDTLKTRLTTDRPNPDSKTVV